MGREAREIIGRDGDADNNGFKKEEGQNTDCPREKTHGDEVDG